MYFSQTSKKGNALRVMGAIGTLLSAGLVLLAAGQEPKARASDAPQQASVKAIEFDRDLAPIFREHCVACHGSQKSQARLRLDSEEGVLEGGVSGRAIIPGNSQESLLVKRIIGSVDAPRMPLGADPLPAQEIDLIRAWIDQGGFAARESGSTGSTPLQAAHGVTTDSGLFASRIRPVLATRCYQCHGADVQQNDLRLDSLAAVLKGSNSGKVVIPGDSERSRLIRRLLGLDRPQMPYGGPPLSAEEIATIRAWIDQGAPGPDSASPVAAGKPLKHWAYIKPIRPEVPKVKNAAWVRNPIDAFVLARLEREGLTPSPEADKETLLRRVSLDLIGLPPTIPEMDAFLADKSPDAYEKVVDRLLASPQYGERWALPWLDLARYADTNGYEKDNRRTAWKYRDWVINALNQDMSFREFTIEQIAGDMLPNPTMDQRIATGFHRNTMLNQEGGVDHMEYYWYSQVDRVNTTASVWLGTTLACAQCHNHKFDPFTQRDYYRFLAFFDNSEYKDLKLGQGEGWVEEPHVELPTPAQETRSKELKAQIASLQTVLDTSTPELEAAQTKWEKEMRDVEAGWTVLRPTGASSKGGATLTVQADQSILASGKNPEADTYTIQANTTSTGITGVRLEVLRDPSLPNGGPGRDPDGNFFLSNFEVEAAPTDKPDSKQKLVFKEAVADESQDGYLIKNVLNTEPGVKGWAIESSDESTPPRRQAVLIPESPFGFQGGTVLTIRLQHNMRHASRNIGRFRLSVTSLTNPKDIVSIPAKLRPVLEIPATQRTAQQKESLAAAYRSIAPELQPTRDRIADLQQQLKSLGIVTSLVMEERPSFERPSTYMHARGSFLSKGERVFAGVPMILNPLAEDELPNRLGLARWLVSDDNPLTARVTVNRFWEQIFGHGIVETVEDFGTQGEPPTHPELLDWLATEFMRRGWSMKQILRTIVTSATYRQSSRVTPELRERDPYNRLLARGPHFRVEAEIVRDIALRASGLLSLKTGGPSVFPYQPDGIWNLPYNDDAWVMSEGEDRYRRGIYTFIRRTSSYPSFANFDAPTREFCTVRRVRTNTPLQALTTLNDPAFFEAARALAKRMVKEAGPDPAGRATYGFRLCTSRRPHREELDRLLTFYDHQLARFRKDEKAARGVIQTKNGPASEASQLAAWTMVSNVLLNLDETITKE
ncbi:MAG TPA: PSD1 and planctomycete cytochrome C domain-containing protein [Terriglobia bacterium]|nr:PSD1 and planctomycete cytochrome C domain-containing protein [Terriglobia bacterium]